ncbi:hypothetical protein Droror1_Dr00004518 [Drosera rotundifolia]
MLSLPSSCKTQASRLLSGKASSNGSSIDKPLPVVHQLLRNKLVATARESIKMNSNLGRLYTSMKDAYNEMQTPLVYQMPPTLVKPPTTHQAKTLAVHEFANSTPNETTPNTTTKTPQPRTKPATQPRHPTQPHHHALSPNTANTPPATHSTQTQTNSAVTEKITISNTECRTPQSPHQHLVANGRTNKTHPPPSAREGNLGARVRVSMGWDFGDFLLGSADRDGEGIGVKGRRRLGRAFGRRRLGRLDPRRKGFSLWAMG